MARLIKQIILASASPHRQALMDRLGLPYEIRSVDDSEERKVTASTPPELAQARARFKALTVARLWPHSLVIGCDQVLDFQGRSYGKASTAEEAKARLAMFAGNAHVLHSAVSLAVLNEGTPQVLDEWGVPVTMRMRQLADAEIAAYVASGEWQGCAGCYRIEGLGLHLFEDMAGADAAIIGLPLIELAASLRKLGINALTHRSPPWHLSF